MLKKLSALWANGKSRKLKGVTLSFAFKSISGDNIYQWPESVALPLNRLAEMLKIHDLIGKNVDGETYNEYLSEMANLAPKAYNDPVAAGKLMTIVSTLHQRSTMFPYRDLLINYCAIWLILETEDPFDFNEETHKYKCEIFARDCAAQGSYFFFAMTNLGYISKWLSASEGTFNELLIMGEERKLKLKEILEYIKTLSKK